MSNLSREDLELIDSMIAARLKQIQMPIARDGVIMGGYNASDATARVRYGDTALMFSDTSDQTIDHPRVALGSPQYGDVYAPRGDEPVVLVDAQGGPIAIFHQVGGTAPGARNIGTPPVLKPGERQITHYNESGTADSYSKYANDGPTSGDGLGGLLHHGGALHSATTGGGHSATMDDTAKRITHQSAGGLQHILDDVDSQIRHVAGSATTTLDKTNQKITHAVGSVQTIVDGAGNAISHVATQIGLGDLPANLPASAAAITNAHITQFQSDLKVKRLDDLAKLCTAMISAGVPNASAVYALIASLVDVPVPAGSAITKIK